jgi:uncharacterized protein YbjT (DUF2867 family)
MKVLVTGGTGVLGSAVLRALRQRGADTRVLSRGVAPTGADPHADWVVAHLGTGAGVDEACAGADVIVHCATTGGMVDAQDDVRCARMLLDSARRHGVGHVVFPGIVGADRATFFPYYAARIDIEKLLTASAIPHTIIRATQFHEFTAFLLQRFRIGPLVIAPRGAALQPVDVRAVADRLAAAALSAPAGRMGDVAGPEIMSIDRLARTWHSARGERVRVLRAPVPVAVGGLKLLMKERLVSAKAERIGVSWSDWLADNAQRVDPYSGRAARA